ncbi:hypothetical protein Q9189_005376 [Teloschistes chrysophthalmus]
MAPSKPAYDIDWVFSNNSDVHVANHRDWFTSYTPFPTRFDCGITTQGNDVEVIGIGDVELQTKTHPTKTGAAYQHKLVLRNVLYAPGVFCNILGGHQHHWQIGGPVPGKLVDPATGKCVGLLDSARLIRLRLRGQSSTQTSLDKHASYFVRANWAPSERMRWQAYQDQEIQGGPTSHANLIESISPPLTQPEKKCLKDQYGGEFHFLQTHGLSIYKDEDREEGRRILRTLMNDANLDDEKNEQLMINHDDDDSGNESENSFLRELEEDPTSHVADHYFTEEELDWIKKRYDYDDNSDNESENSFLRELPGAEEDPTSHVADHHFSEEELEWIKTKYGHSARFLTSYGLKFYDEDDCNEARNILRELMDNEEAENDPDNNSENSFLRELEEDPTSHVADHHFSDEELDWIKTNYGHSGNFLLSHGLKFYDDDDCRESKAMVQAYLSNEMS